MRHAIGRSRVTSDDLDIRFAKRGAQHRSGTVTIIDDVRPDALGLRVDVDADDAGLRHGERCPDDQSRMRRGTARTIYDRGWSEIQLPRLRENLVDGGGIAHRTKRAGHAVRHQTGPLSVSFSSSHSAPMAPLRSPSHGTSCVSAPNNRLSRALPDVSYSGVGGASRP